MHDMKMCELYIGKATFCAKKGKSFELGFDEFKYLMLAPKCYYTGLPLNQLTRTLDRIDNSVGYVKGNVVACHKSFNNLKSLIENPTNPLSLQSVISGLVIADDEIKSSRIFNKTFQIIE